MKPKYVEQESAKESLTTPSVLGTQESTTIVKQKLWTNSLHTHTPTF